MTTLIYDQSKSQKLEGRNENGDIDLSVWTLSHYRVVLAFANHIVQLDVMANMRNKSRNNCNLQTMSNKVQRGLQPWSAKLLLAFIFIK